MKTHENFVYSNNYREIIRYFSNVISFLSYFVTSVYKISKCLSHTGTCNNTCKNNCLFSQTQLHTNVKLQIAATSCISNLVWNEQEGKINYFKSNLPTNCVNCCLKTTCWYV